MRMNVITFETRWAIKNSHKVTSSWFNLFNLFLSWYWINELLCSDASAVMLNIYNTTTLDSHHHHKRQWLDPLIHSVSRVTAARANASSVFQLFSFHVVCGGMISKGFGFVAFFASVKASSVCIVLELIMCLDVAEYWLAFVIFGWKTWFEFVCGDSVLREVGGVLRNFPEVSYFIIILFSGKCAFFKILPFWTHLQTRAGNIVRVGGVVRLSRSTEWIF